MATFHIILLSIASSGLAIDVPLFQNKTLILHCPLENVTQSFYDDILWTKNGELLNWTGFSSYRQERAQLDDSGVYICNVQNRTQLRYHVIVGDIAVAQGKNITLHCPEVGDNHSSIVWSKDGDIIENQTESTYTLSTVQFEDGGNYLCNNSGTEKKNALLVGKIPTMVPQPKCLTSPNTTVWCFSKTADYLPNKICLNVDKLTTFGGRRHLKKVCRPKEKKITTSINLDVTESKRYLLKTDVSNDFGESSSTEAVHWLFKKVIPDPPVNVKLETATGEYSFNASFDIPDSWKPASVLKYEYIITYTATGEQGEPQTGSSNNSQTVKFNIRLKDDLPGFSRVCMTVKIRCKSFECSWSNPSQETCNYTEAKKPSRGPQNITMVTDELKDAYRVISLEWLPPPEKDRNGIIESYELVVMEKSTKDKILNVTLPGNKTTWSNTLAPLDPYKEYEVNLAASTAGGRSRYSVYPLVPVKRRRQIVFIVAIGIICLAAIVTIVVGGWMAERKMHSPHLPEPRFLPESQLRFLLSRQKARPLEKEVFDDLKCPAEVQAEEMRTTHDESPTKESETNQEASPLVGDGYVRRDSGDLPCPSGTDSFSDLGMEVTSADLTPNQTEIMFTFSDIESPKSCESAEETCHQSIVTGTAHDSVETVTLGATQGNSHYIEIHDVRMQSRSSDHPGYENYSLPFHMKVMETMRKLN